MPYTWCSKLFALKLFEGSIQIYVELNLYALLWVQRRLFEQQGTGYGRL